MKIALVKKINLIKKFLFLFAALAFVQTVDAANVCRFGNLEELNEQAETGADSRPPAHREPRGVEVFIERGTKPSNEVFGAADRAVPSGPEVFNLHRQLGQNIAETDKKMRAAVHAMSDDDIKNGVQRWIDEHCGRPEQYCPGQGGDDHNAEDKKVENLIKNYVPSAPGATAVYRSNIPLHDMADDIDSHVLSNRRFLTSTAKPYYDLKDPESVGEYWVDIRAAYQNWRNRSGMQYLLKEMIDRLENGTMTPASVDPTAQLLPFGHAEF